MDGKFNWTRWAAAGIVLVLSGCNRFSASNEDDIDLELTQLIGNEKPKASERTGEAEEAPKYPPQQTTVQDLNVRVQPGFRLPLLKQIDQKLIQHLPSKVDISTINQRMMLHLVAEENRGSETRFSVQYHKIAYTQNVGGKQVAYDSSNSSVPVPLEAIPYSGMVNNGFSFWLGPDRRLLQIAGFPEFVQRCVQRVPDGQREAVYRQLSTQGSEGNIASFVDDSIGLFPASMDLNTLRAGSTWDIPVRRLEGAVPMMLSTHCVLYELSPENADISYVGTITPVGGPTSQQGIRMEVRRGQCNGRCVLDRATGLPIRSKSSWQIEQMVWLADGTEIPQVKEVVTTIAAFRESDTKAGEITPTAGQTSDRRVSPAIDEHLIGR